MVTYVQFEIVSGILFGLILLWCIHKFKKHVEIQKILWPIFYIAMWRTKMGIPSMEKYGKKYGGVIRLLGYFSIGVGLLSVILIFSSLLYSVILSFIEPQTQAGVMLALPGSDIPGLGTLGFWHWIISILVLAVVHEFSHGIVACAHGLKVKNSGPAIFGFILPIIPAAYVEPDQKQLDESKDYVKYSIIAAGPTSNLLLAVIFMIFMSLVITPIEMKISEPAGFSFDTVPDSPAFESLGEGNFVFTQVDNLTTKDPQEFYNYIIRKSPGDEIKLANDKESYSIIAGENPESKGVPYLGIIGIKQDRDFGTTTRENIFLWFKNLFKWLAALNLFIGLANFLPLGPVDGGQLFKTFLEQIFDDKRKIMKWYGRISAFTLILLLLGLLMPFISKLLL